MIAIALTVASVGLLAGCGTSQADQPHATQKAPVRTRTLPLAARAPKLPGVYLGGGDGPWVGPKVRPHALFLGADFSIMRLRWTDWKKQRADGRGHWIACQGAGGPCQRFWAVIRVTHVQKHHGACYFAIMKVTGKHGQVINGKHGRVIWMVMDPRFGFWVQQNHP